MKNFALACAALTLLAATASAAEPVSKSTLASMGLGGMQEMSDTDGMAVRGKGYFGYGGGTRAAVWGGSTANWYGGQSSSNNYETSASWLGKSSSSVGGSFSFAGKAFVSGAADPTGWAVQGQISGGFAGGGAFAR